MILSVSGTAILVRATGNDPGRTAPFVALGTLILAFALLPLGRHDRGPLPVIARRVPPEMDGGFRRSKTSSFTSGTRSSTRPPFSCCPGQPILVFGLLSSFPVLFNFQFGRFHLATILMATAGMLAFSRGRDILGGAFLAGAVVTKIFPGILLVYLGVRKGGRAILWTLAFSAAYALAALLVFGLAP